MLSKIRTAAAIFPDKRNATLVHSAGVASGSDLGMSESEYDGIMDVNAKGAFLCFRQPQNI